MHIAILGRQPALGTAELERIYGQNSVKLLSSQIAQIETDSLDVRDLGGTLKAGVITDIINGHDWRNVSQKIIQNYFDKWSSHSGKITLGISVYGYNLNPREVQKLGITLKQRLKKSGVSLRLIPNTDIALSTATSHHNKLGLSDNKVELLIVRSNNNQTIVAMSTGAQNITAYALRDQMRPKRDAFVGMLPPKLAQIMINLAAGMEGGIWKVEYGNKTANSQIPNSNSHTLRVLDPFCGTGVMLQEAALMGHAVYGTDLAKKMISYSRENLKWLADSHHVSIDSELQVGDAMKHKWQPPIDAVATETYLGQPFSAPPSPAKLAEVQKICDLIITSFLKNIGSQIKPNTPLCIAVPAWRDKNGDFIHLPLIETIGKLGYKRHEFKNVSQNELLYYRESQVVARELLVLIKT
ncbi:MAG TPA: methyltransferase domain-containing protein [Candidatus Saccharibacteria bacterium]|nr:methyltransferase domain-containing protein [Candidatus Saccharibacteria bacterium]HRQ06879.1 methyltransferase domain-containing protein [Candidatus Saccharibacteria bacterium]